MIEITIVTLFILILVLFIRKKFFKKKNKIKKDIYPLW